MSVILTHPRFSREPVPNPRTRGRPKGTASFRMAARKRALRTGLAYESSVDAVQRALWSAREMLSACDRALAERERALNVYRDAEDAAKRLKSRR